MSKWIAWAIDDIESGNKGSGITRERLRRKLHREVGFIYILHIDGSPHYKIGKSVDPEQRRCKDFARLPATFICIIATNFMSRLESEIHERFRGKQIDGEWYALQPDDLIYLRSLQDVQYDCMQKAAALLDRVGQIEDYIVDQEARRLGSGDE